MAQKRVRRNNQTQETKVKGINEVYFQGVVDNPVYKTGNSPFWRCRLRIPPVGERKYSTNVNIVAFGDIARELKNTKEGEVLHVMARFDWNKYEDKYYPRFIVEDIFEEEK